MEQLSPLPHLQNCLKVHTIGNHPKLILEFRLGRFSTEGLKALSLGQYRLNVCDTILRVTNWLTLVNYNFPHEARLSSRGTEGPKARLLGQCIKVCEPALRYEVYN